MGNSNTMCLKDILSVIVYVCVVCVCVCVCACACALTCVCVRALAGDKIGGIV